MSCDTEQTTWRCGRRGQLAVLAALVMLVISCQGSTTNDEQQAGGGGAADDQIGGSTSEAGASTNGGRSYGGTAGTETAGAGDTQVETGGSNIGGAPSTVGGSASIPCVDKVPVVGEPCTRGCYYLDCNGAGMTTFSCVDGLAEVYDTLACEPYGCGDTECAGDEVCVALHSRYTAVPSYGCYPYPCDDPGLFADDCAQQICDSTVIYPNLDINQVRTPFGVSCSMSM